MRLSSALLWPIVAIVGSGGPALLSAQQEEVVVVGIRASLQTAQSRKRNSRTIQDSIVADDIGKLPDSTSVEAIQRIPGVQIGRDLGEGGGTVTVGGSAVNSGLQVRGLPQVETLLNGREVFSASGSRVLNFEDIPSALLSGIDVYKDPTADLLEGGIAGTIDLRTRKPFDFAGSAFEASVAERYGDLRRVARPEFTALASKRWEVGGGELGALLQGDYQERRYREDQATDQSILLNRAVVPGQTTTLINGTYNTLIAGERRRTAVDGVVQWRATPQLEVYAEASSEELRSNQNQFTFTSSGNANVVPGSLQLFPGTTHASAVAYTGAAVGTVGAWRSVIDVNRQFSLHGNWAPDPLQITADISYTRATQSLVNPAVVAGAVAPLLSQIAWVSGVTQTTVAGVDLTDLASFGGTRTNFQSYLYDTEQHFRGNQQAYRLDAHYHLESNILRSASVGLRFARRTARFNQGATFGPATTSAIQGNAAWFGPVPFSPLFSATESTPVEPSYIVFDPDVLRRQLPAVLRAFAVAPALDNGSADYLIEEKSHAAYFLLNLGPWHGIPLDGNLGARIVRRENILDGQTQTGPTLTPARFSTSRTLALPSVNLRFKLRDNVQLRIAASKAVTYPDFTQIKPSISLLPAQGAATGGNPQLRPTRATQLDASLEWFFSAVSSATWNVFYKKLTDFVLQETRQSAFTVDGVNYNLTSAFNGPGGTIRGTELAYQQFLDFLPAPWNGIGFQANYTYVDARAPTAVAGASTTLPGLSRNNFNLIALYERGPIAFRAAYSWRSQYYTSVYFGSTAQVSANPIFTQQFGWLDAALSFRFGNQWSVYAQGANLLRTRISTFYGAATIPDARTIDDRQFLLGARFTL